MNQRPWYDISLTGGCDLEDSATFSDSIVTGISDILVKQIALLIGEYRKYEDIYKILVDNAIFEIFTRSLSPMHSQGPHIEAIPYVCQEFMTFMKLPLDDMPLYLNGDFLESDISKWRLKHAL
jgi:hypothetical protein